MNSPRERREPNLGGGSKKETHSPRDSLGDHEISHGEISPGYQENLLVNEFPFLTPPPKFGSRRSRGEFINISW